MLCNIRANILFQLRRAHPSYHQVTLERSDFRTDFRTRLKNKQFSVSGNAKLILHCQGVTTRNHQYNIRKKAKHVEFSLVAGAAVCIISCTSH